MIPNDDINSTDYVQGVSLDLDTGEVIDWKYLIDNARANRRKYIKERLRLQQSVNIGYRAWLNMRNINSVPKII